MGSRPRGLYCWCVHSILTGYDNIYISTFQCGAETADKDGERRSNLCPHSFKWAKCSVMTPDVAVDTKPSVASQRQDGYTCTRIQLTHANAFHPLYNNIQLLAIMCLDKLCMHKEFMAKLVTLCVHHGK
jgi:hypothetical protein